MKFINYCLKQSLFLNLLTAFIFICGIYVAFTIQKEAFPLMFPVCAQSYAIADIVHISLWR